MRLEVCLPITMCLVLSACIRWDADTHYQREKQAMGEKLLLQRASRAQGVTLNIEKSRSEATRGIRLGLSSSALQQIAGYRYSLLARIANGDQLWERRRYLLSDVVASRWGSFSMESRLCDKRAELFTVTLVNGVIREVDYGY